MRLKTREDNYFREDDEELDLGDDDNQEPDLALDRNIAPYLSCRHYIMFFYYKP